MGFVDPYSGFAACCGDIDRSVSGRSQKEDEGNPIRSEEEMEQSSDKPLEDDPDNTQPQDQDEQDTDADTSKSLEENNPDNTQEEDNASSDGNSSEENYQQLAEDFAKEKRSIIYFLQIRTIRCQKIGQWKQKKCRVDL